MEGCSGATVRQVGRIVRRMGPLSLGRYSAVVLSVGSNDICDARCTPESVVGDLLDLSQLLVNAFGIPEVIVCQVIRRQSTSHFRGLGLEQYNAAVDRVNDLLKARCTGKIVFWRHHHGVLGGRHLHEDGIHLNEHGQKAFQSSVIRALSRC